MSSALYLPFDTETGGLGDTVSLLSAHFAACDESWNVVDELDLFIKPNDGIYVTTAEALSINKINLIEHDKIALTYSQAGEKLRNFIKKNSGDGKTKLIPLGKNVHFDILKVTGNILGPKTWNQYVSYRLYDLTGLIIYLKRKGKLPANAPDSLEGLAKYFNIQADWHTAKGDNLAQIKLVKLLEDL